ncbi:MAG: UDP-3-O-(3-hydroxymyristoyl)glucosamine N-acyltransferase [Thermodesulfovibrionales bacterium]
MLVGHCIASMKLQEFALLVHGELRGNGAVEITGVSDIAGARDGDITFLASAKYLPLIASCKASALIVKDYLDTAAIPQIRAANPHYAFAKALEIFHPEARPAPGIDPAASVAPTASIAPDASVAAFVRVEEQAAIGNRTVIHPGVFIGKQTTIGSDCVIHPNVTIRDNVTIGDRVVIHAGTVIGSDGFGYVFERGEHYKIPQVGGVIIEDDVEIGANVSIDRATIGHTFVGRGTKIDNLVQIAHNVRIGEKSIIVAQVGIAGSTELGSFVTLGGQVGVADHAKIDSGTMVGAQAGIAGHVEKGVYIGSPAIPHKTWMRAQAVFSRLPDLQKKVRELENRLNALEKGEKDAERD